MRRWAEEVDHGLVTLNDPVCHFPMNDDLHLPLPATVTSYCSGCAEALSSVGSA